MLHICSRDSVTELVKALDGERPPSGLLPAQQLINQSDSKSLFNGTVCNTLPGEGKCASSS